MSQLANNTLYTNSLTGQTGSTVTVPAGHVLYAPGQMLQMLTYTDISTGTIYTTTSGSWVNNTVYTFTITPYATGSTNILWCNVMVGQSNADTSGIWCDNENRNIQIYRNGTQIPLNNNSSSYILGGFWGTDVSWVGQNTNWYNRYETDCRPVILQDPTTNTAGSLVTYTIVCGMLCTDSGVPVTFPYNKTNSGGASQGGSSSYTVMEIAQ